MKSRQSHSLSTTPHPPTAIPPSPPSSSYIPSPRSPASPFRFTGHTQANFSSSAHSPPVSSPRVSPIPAETQQSSMSTNSVILSLAELFPVGTQDPHSENSLASTNGKKGWFYCCAFFILTFFFSAFSLICLTNVFMSAGFCKCFSKAF